MYRRIGLALILLAGLLFGAWRLVAWRRWHPPASARLVLVASPNPDHSGLSLGEIRVLEVLLDDALETYGDCSVLRVPSLPTPTEWGPGPDGYILRLLPERQGSNLALHFQLGKASDCRVGKMLETRRAPALPPAQALEWLRSQLPSRPDSDEGRIFPANTAHFWELLAAYSESRTAEFGTQGLNRLTAGALKDPRCASWHAAIGFAHFTSAQNGPIPEGVLDPTLREALVRAPGHPRVVSARVSYLVDRGALRQAMDELKEARSLCPRSARLLTSLENIARYSGALSLAQAADAESNRRALGSRKSGLVRFSMLYAGDIEGFAQSLRPGIDPRFSASLSLHRGYLAAARGKVSEALEQLRIAETSAQIAEPERRLASAYRKALDGDPPGARAELDGLAQTRSRFTMPDGEFLFRLAEGYALLGDSARSLELANQAFLHGFGCTRWFENSPYLTPVRKGPRWVALQQHLLERQVLLEKQLVPSAWGL